MHNTRRFIISGHVQGVNFRAATCERARALGLAGWVRNLTDGRVEAQATGDAHALDALRDWLADGPSAARVEHVTQTPLATDDNAPQPFSVR
jgi:acylphosphatase